VASTIRPFEYGGLFLLDAPWVALLPEDRAQRPGVQKKPSSGRSAARARGARRRVRALSRFLYKRTITLLQGRNVNVPPGWLGPETGVAGW
jgi:hypothetical protein